jgi:signal transduction histidine kinase/ligand-binding sensor domain-containing protein
MIPRRTTLLLAAALSLWVDVRPARGAELRGVFTDYSLTTWGLAEGLPSNVIWAIAQSDDGYLWLGTDAGPIRFDGVRFVTWAALGLPALPGVAVRALTSARDGSLWFGFGAQGGVVRLQRGAIRHYGPGEGLEGGAVTALFEHPDGTLWAGNQRGLYRLAADRWERVEAGVPATVVYTAYVDRHGGFLVGTAVGTFRRGPGQDRFEEVGTFSDAVQGISEDAFGTLWVSDEIVGFRTLHDGGMPAPSTEKARGSRLLRDRRGNLWVGTLGRGLWRLRPDATGGAPAIEKTTALTGFTVTSLFEDREGHLWAGTATGLNRLTPYKVTSITDLGLVRGVESTPDGSVWVGTFDALFRFRDGDVARRDGPETLSAPLSAMHADARGTLWVATEQNLIRLDAGRLSAVPLPGGRPTGEIRSLTSDSQGGLWMHDLGRGVSRVNGRQVEPLALPPHLQAVGVTVTYADRGDRIWLAFANGWIGVVGRGAEARFYGPEDGLEAGVYRAIYEDQDGVVWLGGTEGLTRFAEGRFATLHAKTGFPTGSVTAIVEDDAGCLWLAIQGVAIVQIRRAELARVLADPSHRPRYNVYDTFDGLAGTPRWFENRGAVRAGDGRLWFVGGRGVTVIDPAAFPADGAPPVRVRIESAYLDDRRVPATAQIQLPPRTTRLEIQYAVPNLGSPLETRFRHRLEGLDASWIEAGTRTEAFYTNLPPRRYRFQVMASNEDGTWAAPAAVWDFSIAPMFYQTAWFAAVCVAAAILAVAGLWQYHLRQVRQRFGLLLGERARLSREIHDTLLQSLVGVALQLDVIANDLESSAPPAREQFVRMRRNVEEYIREARQSIWDLRSLKLGCTDLAAALREAGENATSGAAVRFHLTVKGTTRRCPAKVEEQLLRIGQEAILNAVRHAQPREVCVELQYNEESVVLRVLDDGHGFNPERVVAEAEGHYGLVSMKERAEEIGGGFRISSSIGRGTEVETVVPVSAHA